MKWKIFWGILLFIAFIGCCLFFPKENLFKAGKSICSSTRADKEQAHSLPSDASSLIVEAVRTHPQQLPVLPYPPAPLQSVSAQEADDFPGACVVESAEFDGPLPHQKVRLRILQTELKIRSVRTEEIIDTESGNLLGRLEMAANQLLVTLSPGQDPQQFLRQFGKQNVSLTPISATLPLYCLTLPTSSLATLPEALRQLQNKRDAQASGEPNYIAHFHKRPPNNSYLYQWGLWKNGLSKNNLPFRLRYENYFYKWMHNELDFFNESDPTLKQQPPSFSSKEETGASTTDTGTRDPFSTKRGINAEDAWDIRTSASSVIVALIDSGIRYTHESLKDNIWQNPKPNPQYNDLHGFNAVDNNGIIWDELGHGTHCAGIIGGKAGSDHSGISGVAWQIQLMACKCSNKDNVMPEDVVIRAIDYAKQHGATILNCSLGWTAAYLPIAGAVELQSLHDAGIILVTSAGNDGIDNDISFFRSYPASFSLELDNIVSVAATDYLECNLDEQDAPSEREGLASFSNYGANTVSLAAPGTFILSTYNVSDTSYVFLSGTSMSAPFVTGALALLKAHFPQASYLELIQHLLKTTDSLPSLDGKMIGGRLNVARALRKKPDPATPSAPSVPLPDQGKGSSLCTEWKFLEQIKSSDT